MLQISKKRVTNIVDKENSIADLKFAMLLMLFVVFLPNR